MRILVIEDNVDLARQIRTALEQAMYVVDLCFDGQEGAYLGENESYDAVILDLGLPKQDGLLVLENWRSKGIDVPILILTSRVTWREKVIGLRAGADDYMVKPFEYDELLARLEALIRRASGHAESVMTCGDVTVDTGAARVTFNGQLVQLTAMEYRLLVYLIRHQGKVISKTELTEHIYSQDFDRDSNVIEVLINHLRHKLGPNLIRTHRGLGYQIFPPDEDSA